MLSRQIIVSCLTAFLVSISAVSIYLVRNDPALMARRVKTTEKKKCRSIRNQVSCEVCLWFVLKRKREVHSSFEPLVVQLSVPIQHFSVFPKHFDIAFVGSIVLSGCDTVKAYLNRYCSAVREHDVDLASCDWISVHPQALNLLASSFWNFQK